MTATFFFFLLLIFIIQRGSCQSDRGVVEAASSTQQHEGQSWLVLEQQQEHQEQQQQSQRQQPLQQRRLVSDNYHHFFKQSKSTKSVVSAAPTTVVLSPTHENATAAPQPETTAPNNVSNNKKHVMIKKDSSSSQDTHPQESIFGGKRHYVFTTPQTTPRPTTPLDPTQIHASPRPSFSLSASMSTTTTTTTLFNGNYRHSSTHQKQQHDGTKSRARRHDRLRKHQAPNNHLAPQSNRKTAKKDDPFNIFDKPHYSHDATGHPTTLGDTTVMPTTTISSQPQSTQSSLGNHHPLILVSRHHHVYAKTTKSQRSRHDRLRKHQAPTMVPTTKVAQESHENNNYDNHVNKNSKSKKESSYLLLEPMPGEEVHPHNNNIFDKGHYAPIASTTTSTSFPTSFKGRGAPISTKSLKSTSSLFDFSMHATSAQYFKNNGIMMYKKLKSNKTSKSHQKLTKSSSFHKTAAPSTTVYRAFSSEAELRAAVDAYLQDNSDTTATAQVYGHPIGAWDVSKVQSFYGLFDALGRNPAAATFNEDISGWNMGAAKDTSFMFNGAAAFDQPIGIWDTSKVTVMTGMFQKASSFNQNLDGWDVGSVTDMRWLFNGASSFQGMIPSWDVCKVTNMHATFQQAHSFNSDISSWDVSSVTDMSWLFYNATSFNGNIGSWQVGQVTNMRAIFNRASSFNIDISSWQIGNVVDFTFAFLGAQAFQQNLCPWGSRISQNGGVPAVFGMFQYTQCVNTFSPDLQATPPGPFCADCVT